MKNYLAIMLGIIVFTLNVSFTNGGSVYNKKTLSGKITDKNTGEPVIGAAIYLPDLKTGASADINGYYKLENLPATTVLVQVTAMSYKLIVERVDLTTVSEKDFVMEEAVAELHEIVVTGSPGSIERNRTPTPITTLSKIQLLQNTSTNIIDALSAQPGVSQITTGSGISKPVIRGLGYNRVVVVNDGIRQEGQQWGDEHGIEIDEFSIYKVEILKGPASLSYGSDAMAGVINMLTAPTLPEGEVNGNVLTNYQTNNGLIGYSANFAGNKRGFIWDLRYSGKNTHAYKNRYDGYVFNSGFSENTVSGITGINKSWGYSHLHFSSYNFTPGLIEGDRDSATGKFIKPIAENDTTAGEIIVPDKDFTSYKQFVPNQKIHHYKAVLNNSFFVGHGTLKTTVGFQQNHRKEFSNILNPGDVELYFLLNTFNYDVRYLFPEKKYFNITFGVNGMQQSSKNKGKEFLIPEYSLFDFGIYTIAKKSFNRLDISGGLRYDNRYQNSKELYLNAEDNPTNASDPTASKVFSAFNKNYQGLSGSIGAAFQFNEKVYSKFNISKGFRMPNITELSANGVHEGTINYLIGVPMLKSESSLQVDYAIGVNSEHVTTELDLFGNSISNYIFLQKLNSTSGSDSITEGFSTFKYSSGNAFLRGCEFSIDIHPHPLDWLHFENTFSFVRAIQINQPDSTMYLPLIPAPKITTELRATAKKLGKHFVNCYVKAGVDNYLTQDNFYSAYGTETETPGYTLINLGMGTDVTSKNKTLFSIYISATNITDIAYQSHLNRLKYAAENMATGRTGIFNMGRNISFKLLVPFAFNRK